jgi:hypothetical protein
MVLQTATADKQAYYAKLFSGHINTLCMRLYPTIGPYTGQMTHVVLS